jgi:hypothetical protein
MRAAVRDCWRSDLLHTKSGLPLLRYVLQVMLFANVLMFCCPNIVSATIGDWTYMGLDGQGIGQLAIAPNNRNTVYGLGGGLIFKSTDGGSHWIPITTGLYNTNFSTFAIDPTNSNTVYAPTENGVYKSTNGGTTWSAINTGLVLLDTGVGSLAIDPTNSNTVYAPTENGVYKSTNGGTTWSAINTGLTNTIVHALAIDSTGTTLYAGTDSGIFKSSNGEGPPSVTITSTAGSNGTISPLGAVAVNYGFNQSFTITPAAHYHVATLLVDGNPVTPATTYEFTHVTADHTISATFAIDTHTITATAGTNGSISPSGLVVVNNASNQSFTITPATCCQVQNVLVDGVSVGSVTSYTFTNVTANHIISASFALDTTSTATIIGLPGNHGTISPSGSVSVKCGSDQTFVISPAAGYHVADILVDNADVGAVSKYTFHNVSANHTISGSFDVSSVWYVDNSASIFGDGKAWTSAFKNIQQAVDEGKPGDEIWVRAADYHLIAPVKMNKLMSIYGGFAGIEDQRDKRNWQTYRTTLDGQMSSQCLQVSDNAVIDGFVITNCHGSLGGGVSASSATVNFSNCRFVSNSADSGGAVYQLDASVNFNNCLFWGNSANLGGAIYNESAAANITSCTLSRNNAASGGGAILHTLG